MFGIVFAMLNTSACSAVPSAAASRVERTKPLSRETTVPAAITALDPITEGWAACRPLIGPPRRIRPSLAAPPVLSEATADPAQDHHHEQAAAADQRAPDQLAALAGAQAERQRPAA